MSAPHIAVIVGSLRKASLNRQLAHAVERVAGDRFRFQLLDIGGLPLYNQDDDADFPAPSLAFKAGIEAADGLLFVTPEYNRSIPGVLKNAIDIASRPAGSTTFSGKRAGIVGISPGAHGTVSSQQHLRNVLAAVDVAVLPQPEIALQYKDGMFDAAGDIADERARKRLLTFLDRFEAWIRA